MSWFQSLVSLFIGKKSTTNAKKTKLGSSLDVSSFESIEDIINGESIKNLKQKNAQYCNCCDTLSNAFSLVSYKCQYKEKDIKAGDFRFREMLTLTPNRVQTMGAFLKTVGDSFFKEQLAMIYVERNKNYEPIGLWSIDVDSMEISKDDSNNIWLTFPTQDGMVTGGKAELTVPLADMITLVNRPTAKNPFAATDKSIDQVISVIKADYDGFEAAVKQSHLIRYILTKPSIDDDDEQRREDFNSQIKADKNGLIILNHAENLQAINSSATYAKQPEMEGFENAVYSYFHVNKNIIQSNLTDTQYHYFMQLAIAPLAIQLEQELNRKILTFDERTHGNRIKCILDPIEHASIETKKSVANVIKDSGAYTPNEIRTLLDLPLLPEEDGDVMIHSLNFSGDSMNGGNNAAATEQDEKSTEGKQTQADNQQVAEQEKEEGDTSDE